MIADVVGMLERRGVPHHDAQDIAQDSFLTALEKGESHNRPYIMGTAKNKMKQRQAAYTREQRNLDQLLAIVQPTTRKATRETHTDDNPHKHRHMRLESHGETFLVQFHEFTCRVCGSHDSCKNGAKRMTVRCRPCRRVANAEAYQRKRAAA